MKKISLLLLLFAGFASAQVEYSTGANPLGDAPLFYIDYAEYLGSVPNKSRLDLFIQVPYAGIQFVKKDNSFNAAYNVSLTFYDKDKNNVLFEKIWKERVAVTDFTQTLSRNNFNLSHRIFDLAPGEYFVKCLLEDTDSRRTASREFPLMVNAVSDTLGLSSAMLISEIMKDSTGEKIVPNISKVVTSKNKSFPFYFEVYSNKDRDIFLEFFLESIKSKTSTKTLEPHKIKAGTNTIYFTLENTEFTLGEYILKVVLKNGDWKEISSAEKKFYSKIQGFPNSIADLDKAVEQMLYIASPDELDQIEDEEAYDKKLELFLAFWEKKKPNKNTDENPVLYEYYRRIEYANKNFKGLGEGWRSDMGMIYVTFGPPNHVERHPLDPDSKPYEVWDYYDLNRSFVFLDQTGFGDYRLVNPDYSRWPGYRQ